MKIVIGNYADPNDNRNLILNTDLKDHLTGDAINNVLVMITTITGLETPPYRNGTGNWSGADGGYMSTQFYGARSITINGFYFDGRFGCDYINTNDEQFSRLARLYIRSRLPIRKKQLVRIFLGNGLVFFADAYCTDLKMDYSNIKNGEYQLSLYCPDPALYRGGSNGELNSEWNNAVVYKENQVGYDSSWVENGEIHYATMDQRNGENHGIVWKTGGRSTSVDYNGDYPGYPQLIVTVNPGEHCINPTFYSVTENKTFSLGYPNSRVAVFNITSVDENGSVTGVDIVSPGAYDDDYTGLNIQMQNYSLTAGSGCHLNLTATQNENKTWSFTTASVRNGGSGFNVGDKLTPLIAGAAIFQLSPGQKLVVDMAEKTVMVYSGDRYSIKESCSYYITTGSEWFSLKPLSINNIVYTSAGEDDVKTCIIQWRNGYQGI